MIMRQKQRYEEPLDDIWETGPVPSDVFSNIDSSSETTSDQRDKAPVPIVTPQANFSSPPRELRRGPRGNDATPDKSVSSYGVSIYSDGFVSELSSTLDTLSPRNNASQQGQKTRIPGTSCTGVWEMLKDPRESKKTDSSGQANESLNPMSMLMEVAEKLTPGDFTSYLTSKAVGNPFTCIPTVPISEPTTVSHNEKSNISNEKDQHATHLQHNKQILTQHLHSEFFHEMPTPVAGPQMNFNDQNEAMQQQSHVRTNAQNLSLQVLTQHMPPDLNGNDTSPYSASSQMKSSENRNPLQLVKNRYEKTKLETMETPVPAEKNVTIIQLRHSPKNGPDLASDENSRVESSGSSVSSLDGKSHREEAENDSPIFFDKDDPDQSPEPGKQWNRLVCCSVKNRKNMHPPIVHHLPESVIVNKLDKSKKNKNDITVDSYVTKGTATMSSDDSEPSIANRSVSYDFESNPLHVDVVYTKFVPTPRTFVTTRWHNSQPTLDDKADWDEDVIVRIEASTVSDTDCAIRRGEWWGPQTVSFPNTPGVDMVGKIYKVKRRTAARYDLQPNQRVMSLIKWGGNSRYIQINPKQLVKVESNNIDPVEAACLPETYLTAFQMLHFGQYGMIRYHKDSLKDKTILIRGYKPSNMNRALIDLALNGGAGNIYATAKKKHWKALVMWGIMPLSLDPNEWISRLEGKMDLILVSDDDEKDVFSGNRQSNDDDLIFSMYARSLRNNSEKGHMLLTGRQHHTNKNNEDQEQPNNKNAFLNSIRCGKNKKKVQMMNQIHTYDVYEEWEQNLDKCRRDLVHLLELLEKSIIKPKILDRIPLKKVAKAQEFVESKRRLASFLVCEPWPRKLNKNDDTKGYHI